MGAQLARVLAREDLTDLWDLEACEIVAGLYPRLHVPAPPQLRSLTSYVARWAADLDDLPRNAPVPRRLVEQASALVRHARETRAALATDYTYLQPAQPTTVGHLLLTYAYPALRDADRVRTSYTALGASVAGAGGSAGSRWALDPLLFASSSADDTPT